MKELAQEIEGDVCIHCVSGCVARQEAQQDSLGAGKGGNGCRQAEKLQE